MRVFQPGVHLQQLGGGGVQAELYRRICRLVGPENELGQSRALIHLSVLPSLSEFYIEPGRVHVYNGALPFSRSGAPAMLRISQEALTFDDILLVPGYSEVLPNEVSL